MQEVIIIDVIMQELLKNIMYNRKLKVIAQEILRIGVIVQEVQLSWLFKG